MKKILFASALALIFLVSGAFAHDESFRPVIKPGDELGYFIFQNEHNIWTLCGNGDSKTSGQYHVLTGNITTDTGFCGVRPFALERRDKFRINDTAIHFNARVGPHFDCVRFVSESNAVLLSLAIDGNETDRIYFGADKERVVDGRVEGSAIDKCPQKAESVPAAYALVSCQSDSDCASDQACIEAICLNAQEALDEEEEIDEDEQDDEFESELEEANIISNKTRRELLAITTQHGWEVRMLQLQEAIEKNRARANEIIADIQEKNESNDVSGLDAIVLEMQALSEDVLNASQQEYSENNVRLFVDFKHDAIELTTQFKDAAHVFLRAQEREIIRERQRTAVDERVQAIKEKVRSRVHEYNAERIRSLLANSDINATAIAQRIRQENLSVGEIKQEVKNRIDRLEPQQRQAIANNVRIATNLVQTARNRIADVVNEDIVERQKERIQERIEQVDRKFNLTGIAQHVNVRLRNVLRASIVQNNTAVEE